MKYAIYMYNLIHDKTDMVYFKTEEEALAAAETGRWGKCEVVKVLYKIDPVFKGKPV